MKLNFTEANINKQVEYIYTFFKPEIESKGLTFTFTIPYNKEEKIEIEQIPENIDKDITSTGKLNQ